MNNNSISDSDTDTEGSLITLSRSRSLLVLPRKSRSSEHLRVIDLSKTKEEAVLENQKRMEELEELERQAREQKKMKEQELQEKKDLRKVKREQEQLKREEEMCKKKELLELKKQQVSQRREAMIKKKELALIKETSKGQEPSTLLAQENEKQLFPIFNCRHELLGCPMSSLDMMERDLHSQKCIYSVLHQCKDPDCIADGLRPYKTLEELVNHATVIHGCTKLKKGENARDEKMQFEVNLDRSFLSPVENDFSAKILATYEEFVDDTKLQIAFFGVVTDGKEGDMFLLPVLYGETSQLQYFIRLDLTVMDFTGKKLRTIIHPVPLHSHQRGHQIITRPLRSGKPVLEAIKNGALIKLDKCEIVAPEGIKFTLALNVLAYRCHVEQNERDAILFPHLLTTEEVRIEGDTVELLGLDISVQRLAITGTLLPYLRAGKNLEIECNDLNQVMCTILAAALEDKRPHDQFSHECGAVRNPVYLVLLPKLFMMEALKSSIQDMAAAAGLVCNFIPDAQNDEIIDDLLTYGCDVVVTTPCILQELGRIEEFSYALFDELSYVIVPNSDYLLKKDSAIQLHQCVTNFPEGVREALVKVTISPFLNDEQQAANKYGLFGEEHYATITLGPKFCFLFKMLPVFQWEKRDFADKAASIKKVMNIHDPNKKWLILISEETDSSYENHIQIVSERLKLAYSRKSIVRIDTKETMDESLFLPIKRAKGVIILSSYFTLHYESIKMVGGVILLNLPPSPAELMRLLPIVKNLKKPIYWLKDERKGSNTESIVSYYDES